jgi:hypothetical protein
MNICLNNQLAEFPFDFQRPNHDCILDLRFSTPELPTRRKGGLEMLGDKSNSGISTGAK